MSDLFKDVEEIKPDGEQPLHFYYNREERIAKASPQVQEYYNGGMRPVKGIKVFFLKQNRYIFFALILFVAAGWIYTGLNKTRDFALLGGVDFNLTAFSFKEEVYVSLAMERSRKADNNLPVPLTASIFVIDSNNQVSDKREMSWVYNDGEEFLETKFTDYDIMRIDIILNVDGEEKEISSAVKRSV